MPFLPSSVVGSNWSTPKGKLQGLIPPVPMDRNPRAKAKKPNCLVVGPSHWLTRGAHDGGCNFGNATIKVMVTIPCMYKRYVS
ncbi:hypothetical protein Hanom_Chr17g01548671 [Helianthus anomalus]